MTYGKGFQPPIIPQETVDLVDRQHAEFVKTLRPGVPSIKPAWEQPENSKAYRCRCPSRACALCGGDGWRHTRYGWCPCPNSPAAESFLRSLNTMPDDWRARAKRHYEMTSARQQAGKKG